MMIAGFAALLGASPQNALLGIVPPLLALIFLALTTLLLVLDLKRSGRLRSRTRSNVVSARKMSARSGGTMPSSAFCGEAPSSAANPAIIIRSEERRVGKEDHCGGGTEQYE